jgi:hypothetical protein
VVYAVLVVVVSVVAATQPPSLLRDTVQTSSTNLVNLRQRPLSVTCDQKTAFGRRRVTGMNCPSSRSPMADRGTGRLARRSTEGRHLPPPLLSSWR